MMPHHEIHNWSRSSRVTRTRRPKIFPRTIGPTLITGLHNRSRCRWPTTCPARRPRVTLR